MRTSVSKIASAILLGGIACHDSTGPKAPQGPLSIVAGNLSTDTVQAKLSQALIVEVRDNGGRPLSGIVVRFSPIASSNPFQYPNSLVAPLTGDNFSYFTADSTDSRGRAAVVVQLGTLAGPAKILIEVPELSLQDTARYTVLPGAAQQLAISVRDTTVGRGAQYSLSAAAADRFGNKRPNDPITFTSRSAVATVDAAGKVTAAQEGRGTILVQTGTATDSAQLSVVPLLEMVVWGGQKLSTINTDDSQPKVLTTSTDASLYPQWSPDGTQVLIYEADPGSNARMSLVDMSGTRTVVAGPGPSLYAASYGRFTRDGSWIYFTGISTTTYGYQTFRIKPDGTQLEQIGPTPSEGGSMRPDISPDGTTEIFQFASGGIGSMNIPTHTIKTLSALGSFPRYSPDGSQIAYLAPGSNYYLQLWVMNADGSSQHQVSFTSYPYWDLGGVDWSPDGKWLLSSTYSELDLIRVSDGLRLPLRVPAAQASFKP